MAINEQQILSGRRREDKILEAIAGGSMVKAIGGAIAVVLAIIGLAQVHPALTLSIATIAVGVGLMFEGGAIAARYSRTIPRPVGYETVELGGGMTSEFFGGAAGVVLGILGLVGISPILLNAIAAIVFGTSLLLGSSIPSRINALALFPQEEYKRSQDLIREAASAATGSQILIGLGAIVLGVLAVIGIGPVLILTLVALLSLGFSILLSGTTVSSKFMSIFRH
jgi:hypothetical protein